MKKKKIPTLIADKMGCLKLTYQTSESPLKVVYRANGVHPKVVQRFIRIDPLSFDFPHNSPYAFSENIVINATELEGLEKMYTYVYDPKSNKFNYIWTKTDIELKENVNRYVYFDKHGNVTKTVIKSMDGKRTATYHGKEDSRLMQLQFKSSYDDQLDVKINNDRAFKTTGAYDKYEGSDDGAGTAGEYGGKKGLYSKGIPIMAATVGTILTLGSSSVVGGAIASGSANGTGNFLGQWVQTGDVGKVDVFSVALAAGGGLLKNPWLSTAITSTLDAGFDYKMGSGLTYIGKGKSTDQCVMDLGFGLVGGSQSNFIMKANINNNIVNVRTYITSGIQLYGNGAVNDQLKGDENK